MGFQLLLLVIFMYLVISVFFRNLTNPHLTITLLELERSELRLGAYFMGISR